MVTIMIGDRQNVDFDAPVELTPQQKEEFVSLLKSIFDVVEEVTSDEVRLDRLGDKNFSKGLSESELESLLSDSTTEELTQKLGRSWMSVDIKRGWFVQYFLEWLGKKKLTMTKQNLRSLVSQFLKEREEAQKSAREVRRQQRLNKREKIEDLEAKVKQLRKLISAGFHKKNKQYENAETDLSDALKELKMEEE